MTVRKTLAHSGLMACGGTTSGKGDARVLSKAAPTKYTGLAAWLLGLWSQLSWALA